MRSPPSSHLCLPVGSGGAKGGARLVQISIAGPVVLGAASRDHRPLSAGPGEGLEQGRCCASTQRSLSGDVQNSPGSDVQARWSRCEGLTDSISSAAAPGASRSQTCQRTASSERRRRLTACTLDPLIGERSHRVPAHEAGRTGDEHAASLEVRKGADGVARGEGPPAPATRCRTPGRPSGRRGRIRARAAPRSCTRPRALSISVWNPWANPAGCKHPLVSSLSSSPNQLWASRRGRRRPRRRPRPRQRTSFVSSCGAAW